MPTSPYAAGQVWTYRTRPGDEASRVKIQMVEHYDSDGTSAEDRAFHVSVARLTFQNPDVPGEIAHAPVSRETLDASLVDLTEPDSELIFPDPAEGVAAWKEGAGGVFTFSLAELAAMFDDVTADFVAENDNLYFAIDWTHDRPDDPVWGMFEVDTEGRVLRTMHGFADGGGVMTSLQDFEDRPGDLPQPGNLIDGSFFEMWAGVPLGEPQSDDGGGEYVLSERDRHAFADLWRANRD